MNKDISDAISIKLGDAYEHCEIYTKNVRQGLEEPCFYIKAEKSTRQNLLGKRHIRMYPYDVMYFPMDEDDNEHMYEVSDELMELLEYITLVNGDVLRASDDMGGEIIDGVLHFNVTYKVIMNDISKEDSMENFDSSIGLQKG